MENLLKHQENQNPTFLSSPKSYTSNSSSTSSSSNSPTNGLHLLPPQSPIPATRSDPNNPYPTTFVQADSTSFKQVVQMLTGSSKPDPIRNPNPPVKATPKIQKSSSKLYERRNSFRNFKISPLGPTRPGSGPDILSPSILDFPSLALSPVTPLIPDPFNRTGPGSGQGPGQGEFLSSKSKLVDLEAEEKAIAEKGFFLHPSPATTPTDSKPRLLPLFPVTSPRLAGSSNTAA